MGCKSDHMEPTPAEKACQQAAVFIVYINGYLGAPTAEVVMKASSAIYCNDRTLEPMLCGILNDWKERDKEAFEAFIYDGRKAMNRDLASWYQNHEAMDLRRRKQEERAAATNGGIQEAFNNAMAQAQGFEDIEALLTHVRNKGKAITGARQDQINHALAIVAGFDNIEDFIAARGMKGRNPKD